MLARLKSHRVLAGLVLLYYLGFLALGLVTSNPQVPFYAIFMAVTLAGVTWWDSRRHLSEIALKGLALWGALHLAGGMVPFGDGQVLYSLWLLPILRFDHVVHAIGFGFAGIAFRDSILETSTSGPWLAFMGGAGFGAINEMIEFLITRVVPETNIGGFENTGWDLVANTIGALGAAVWVASHSWRRSSDV